MTIKEIILDELKKVEGRGTASLADFLEVSDFFTAPASSEYHLAETGGLAQHSWNVYTALKGIAAKHVPGVRNDSVIICGLLHDICKVCFYKPDFKNKKENGQWIKVPYFAIDDQYPLGHGEKSVIMLQEYIPLTTDETIAIRWHMGAWEADSYTARKTLNTAIDKCPLLRALMLADQFATFFIETKTAK